MAVNWKVLLINMIILKSSTSKPPIMDCMSNYRCVPISHCHIDDSEGGFNFPCHNNSNLICCSPHNLLLTNHSTNPSQLDTRITKLFPTTNCGVSVTDNKITGGKTADYGQFPWMALLGYQQKTINYTQFLCGGTVITDRYILTAAHCINLQTSNELVVVRLGEHNLFTQKDCMKSDDATEPDICADDYIDMLIKRTAAHPRFQEVTLENDIALIELQQRIIFTEYIGPICLPFDQKFGKHQNLANRTLIVSGWGKTNAGNLGGSSTLQYTTVKVWRQSVCNESVPPSAKPIRDSQLCANGDRKEDACKGDSGGPLANVTANGNGEARYYQLGIVSFASSMTCGNPNLPTIYTRVDRFLGWIVENVS